MSWSVVREIGIAYPDTDPSPGSRLNFPVCATQATDGSYLIVDDVWAEKPIPFRLECRTLRVDTGGAILFDSLELGLPDAYGCLAPDNSLAILRRAKWELSLWDADSRCTRSIDLASFSKRLPTVVSCTEAGTFLIVFVDRSHQLDLIEIDREGQLLWYLPPHVSWLGVPTSVQRLPDNTILLADGFHHAAIEIDRQGYAVWQFGESGNPARSPTRLAGPSSVRAVAGGNRLIADTRNHRVLRISPDGVSREVHPHGAELTDPSYADMTPDGQVLICDSGNGRVIQLDEQERIVWQFGSPLRTKRYLSYPRSVEHIGPDEFLIADTAHDRIVHYVDGHHNEIRFRSDTSFFWPRCVRRLSNGSLLVADGRHGRIVEVSEEGLVHRELWELDLGESRRLMDPHDVRLLPNGNLLVTDSPMDAVLEVDWHGHVHRLISSETGCPLKDPHAAQQLPDGRLAICDTGHHRVLFIDAAGDVEHCLETVQAGTSLLRLNRPRYLEAIPGDTMVIVDTGHNRVLITRTSGQLLSEIVCLPDSPISHLHQPRWATLINANELAIVDHYHHRVVHLRQHAVRSGDE